MKLKGRIALITGGAKRVGQAIALELARRGAWVAITYLTSDADARKTVIALKAFRVRAMAIRGDLARLAHIRRILKQVVTRWGGIDILVNNAAAFSPAPLETVTEKQWDKIFDTNLKGPFFLSVLAGRRMVKQKEGVIVNIADQAAFRPYREAIPYSVSKAGLVAMTRAMALALAPNVRVVSIAPGTVVFPEHYPSRTRNRIRKKIPLQKTGSPADIANAVRFLIEDADFATGSTLTIDGGQSLA